MGYDKDGNDKFSKSEKVLTFIFVVIVIGSAMYAGSKGGGFEIPSNEP
jgi:cell division protein FtsL